jgi:hypothetical protein
LYVFFTSTVLSIRLAHHCLFILNVPYVTGKDYNSGTFLCSLIPSLLLLFHSPLLPFVCHCVLRHFCYLRVSLVVKGRLCSLTMKQYSPEGTYLLLNDFCKLQIRASYGNSCLIMIFLSLERDFWYKNQRNRSKSLGVLKNLGI